MYFNVKSYLPDVSIVVCFSFLGFFVAFFNNGSNGLGYKFYVNKEEVKYNASSGFVGFFPSSCLSFSLSFSCLFNAGKHL